MRLMMKLLAPLIFLLAQGLFHSAFARGSRRRHDWVMKLFRIAAESGHRRALSVYGHLLFFRGAGIDSRIQGAIHLQRAAELGDLKALYQLGRIHEAGFQPRFPVDPVQAEKAYRQAAEGGHPLAIKRMLDLCREQGDQAGIDYWQARRAEVQRAQG